MESFILPALGDQVAAVELPDGRKIERVLAEIDTNGATLDAILKQLKIMNIHLEAISGLAVSKEDIE